MPLIKHGPDGPTRAADPWMRWADDDPAAVSGDEPLIVSLPQWQGHRERLAGRNAPLGMFLGAGESPEDIADDLDNFALICLDFPAFTDGRAYSSARVLRDQLGYTSELRAVGNVLRDQLLFMVRCGFDTFEVDDRAADGFTTALSEIGVWYQPAADNRTPAGRLRHPNGKAE